MKQFYTFDNKGYYTGTVLAKISPADDELTFLPPKNSTRIPVPQLTPEESIPQFDKSKKVWKIVSDPMVTKYFDRKREEAARKKLMSIDELGVPFFESDNGRPVPISNEKRKQRRLDVLQVRLKQLVKHELLKLKEDLIEYVLFGEMSLTNSDRMQINAYRNILLDLPNQLTDDNVKDFKIDNLDLLASKFFLNVRRIR